MLENQQYDKRSLSFLKGKNTYWDELAKHVVCFANTSGGKILIGIEDGENKPISFYKRKNKAAKAAL